MAHIIVVNWRVKDGRETEVAATLAEYAQLARAEDGCRAFIPLVSAEDPGRILIYEEYVDEASFEAHRTSPHFSTYVSDRLLPLLEHREAARYTHLDNAVAGETSADDEQGGLPAEHEEAEAAATIRLLLLRHGQVASHSGDVALTEAGEAAAVTAGHRFFAQLGVPRAVLYSLTQRTLRSAELFTLGIEEAGDHRSRVPHPRAAHALRNPDLFLAGERVDMVSTPEALAEQVPTLTPEDCAKAPFFADFMAAPDRIGWWLRHPSPPGDDYSALAKRILDFAQSLAVGGVYTDGVVAAITHSPILRALARELRGTDPGEPEYFTGFLLTIDAAGRVLLEDFDPFSP